MDISLFFASRPIRTMKLRKKIKRIHQPLNLRTLLVVLVTATGLISTACAQFGSDNHTVTVFVQAITTIQADVGSVNMVISGTDVVAGENVMSVINETSRLLWGTNGSGRKTTVVTNLVSSNFVMKVEALNPTQGIAAPEVVLTNTATDFLLNIGRSSGSCTIKYTGIATAEQGIGSDSHLITFTIQSQ